MWPSNVLGIWNESCLPRTLYCHYCHDVSFATCVRIFSCNIPAVGPQPQPPPFCFEKRTPINATYNIVPGAAGVSMNVSAAAAAATCAGSSATSSLHVTLVANPPYASAGDDGESTYDSAAAAVQVDQADPRVATNGTYMPQGPQSSASGDGMYDNAIAVLSSALDVVSNSSAVDAAATGSKVMLATADDEELPPPPVEAEVVLALAPAPAPSAPPTPRMVAAPLAALFAGANLSNGLLSAKEAGALLLTSGLAPSALRSVWTAAKAKGPKACPKGQMDLPEFLIACALAVEAGGAFTQSNAARPDNSEC